ncbi:hypothetical protein OIU35_26785 [Boseaceae bacterium BT-24-1]|nr:hypothetical protein [Boseaceae bacterium BT-24-1]
MTLRIRRLHRSTGAVGIACRNTWLIGVEFLTKGQRTKPLERSHHSVSGYTAGNDIAPQLVGVASFSD